MKSLMFASSSCIFPNPDTTQIGSSARMAKKKNPNRRGNKEKEWVDPLEAQRNAQIAEAQARRAADPSQKVEPYVQKGRFDDALDALESKHCPELTADLALRACLALPQNPDVTPKRAADMLTAIARKTKWVTGDAQRYFIRFARFIALELIG